MTEHTVFECDASGRRARNRNQMEECTVVWASGKWSKPRSRDYHIHVDAILEEVGEGLKDEFDDEVTVVSVNRYCWDGDEIVGAIMAQYRSIGPPGRSSTDQIFVERADFTSYYDSVASLLETEVIP